MNLLKSVLKPSESVAASLATAGLVYGVYQFSLPSVVEIHGASAHNSAVDMSRKKAMWTSTAIVSGAWLITRDPNIWIAGVTVLVLLDWSIRHANVIHPATGQMVPYSAADATAGNYAEDSSSPDEYNG